MRLKFDSSDQSSFRCCFCCHVRTGTIFLGLFHLMVHLFVIAALILACIHPELLKHRSLRCPANGQSNSDDIIIDRVEVEEDAHFQRKMSADNMDVAVIICFCVLTITLFLLYGVFKNRPGYMLPFFCLQVFDFCLSCLTVVGYFSYAPNVKIWLQDQGLSCLPGMEHILDLDGDWLMLFCLLILVLFLSLKAYLIGVVWACYKFIQLRNLNLNQVREYTVDPDTEMLLPPKYEDAIKQPVEQSNPPPPYTST